MRSKKKPLTGPQGGTSTVTSGGKLRVVVFLEPGEGRGLPKACRRLGVPVPPRGYWAKVAAGQRVRRPKLPQLRPGQAEEIVVRVPEIPGVEQAQTTDER